MFVQVGGNNQVKLYILQFPNIISRIVHGVGRGWVAIVQDRGKPVSVLPLRRRALDQGQFHGVLILDPQLTWTSISRCWWMNNNNNNKEDDDTV